MFPITWSWLYLKSAILFLALSDSDIAPDIAATDSRIAAIAMNRSIWIPLRRSSAKKRNIHADQAWKYAFQGGSFERV